MKLDLRELVNDIEAVVKSHELPTPGQYTRWLWQDAKNERQLGVNEYGCADAANILYTIGKFACDEETRKARIRELKALQNKETGMFVEATHHTIHTTAHCCSALELFDEKPDVPLYGLHKYFDKKELYNLLDGLFEVNPWPASHQGAGVYAALETAGEMTHEFSENYFNWFWENACEKTGFWKKGIVDKAPVANDYKGAFPLFAFMAGGFHYFFNHEHAHKAIRYPEKMIDSCIKMYTENGLPDYFAKRCNFIEVDWLYCLNRARRQSTHRNDEAVELIRDFGKRFTDWICNIDHKTDDGFNDLHMLFGSVCALAELQAALPGEVITDRPLRLVLNRRPFI